MKKILGLVFSIIGKLGVVATFVIFGILSIIGKAPYKAKFNFLWILLALFVSGAFVIIGDKLTDNACESGGWLAVKRKIYGVLEFLTAKVMKVIFWVVLIGFILMTMAIIVDVIASVISSELEESELAIVYTVWAFGGIYVFAAGYAEVYNLHHCKHCGANLKGCDYEYEEIERSYHTSSDGKGHLNSKVRFEVECKECETENIWYRTMSTDAEKIDKYMRGIVGRD